MNDFRLPGLTGPLSTGPRTEPASGRVHAAVSPADPLPFDRALERSRQAAPTAERGTDRSSGRSANAELARRRDGDAGARTGAVEARDAAARRADQKAPTHTVERSSGAGDAARLAPQPAPRDGATTAEGAADQEASAAKSAPVDAAVAATPTVVDDSGPAGAGALTTPTPPFTVATPQAASTATATPLVDAQAEATGLQAQGVMPAPSTAADAVDAADAGSGTATRAAATAARAGKPDAAAATAKELVAMMDATPVHSPARDRLVEDFERRYENALGRAAAGALASPLSGSPLAGTGLPSPLAPAGASMTVAYASVAAPVGHAAFAQDLSHRILLFAGQRVQSAEISVTPAELGPIRVSIDVRGQEAAMQFTAAHATTRAAIEDALPRLREMLAAQGLQLSQADVGDQAQRDAGHAGRGHGGSMNPTRDSERAAGAGASALQTTAAGNARSVGLIDIRV